MIDTTEDNKITGEGTPALDSMPLAPVIQIHYIIAIYYPGTSRTPFFEGSYINDFLDRYERMCIDFRVEAKEKIKKLPWYCEVL